MSKAAERFNYKNNNTKIPFNSEKDGETLETVKWGSKTVVLAVNNYMFIFISGDVITFSIFSLLKQ